MKSSYVVLGLLPVLAAICAGCAVAQMGALENAREDMNKQEYPKALDNLSQAWHYSTPSPQIGSEICYLEGLCWEQMDQYDSANAMYRYATNHYPETQFGYLAKSKLEAGDVYISVHSPDVLKPYELQIANVITNNWYQLLKGLKQNQKGMVVLKFDVQTNGVATNLIVIKKTVKEPLVTMCQTAVLKSAPYEKWTPEMIEAVVKPYSTVTFTFHYWK